MVDKDDENDKNSGKLTGVDSALWKKMTKDVRRLHGKEYLEPTKKDDVIEFESQPRETISQLHSMEKKQSTAVGQGVDRRTEERLRRGQMEIEARLDLHGMTQGEAHSALMAFIVSCYEQRKRCVLVITGKGKKSRDTNDDWLVSKSGILKRRVPEWLSVEEMKPYVLRFVTAKSRDGGDGALYVLLRRQRN
ncbi:MAG: Smr/MutS family protein [Alphaproteobacteria bacterium]|nr:Smr/MutS family protein [Alphaproteobacteria bacterium]